MSSSRCWGCCQENCGYSRCGCDCHDSNERAREAVEIRREWAKRIITGNAEAIGAQCPDHRRYQGKRRPRANCESCWRIWIALNPR